MFYVCLTLCVLVGSLVLGNPWCTRSFARILISEMYIIFIWYVMNPTRRHIGIQIWTTDAIHTVAYQVIPTLLNQNIHNRQDLPPDYRVSRNNLYVEDIPFDYNPPTIGHPNADENEVLRALPPYPNCQQPLMEAAQIHYPTGVIPNLGNWLFGLPTVIQREPECPEGAVRDPLVDCAPSCMNQIRIPDTEVHATLSAALYPEIPISNPSYERGGGGASGRNQPPPTPPPTRANSPTGIPNNGQIPLRAQCDHLPPRCQPARAQPLGQPYPRPPPRAPPRAVMEPLAGCEVPSNQCRPHRAACHCARCRPGRPQVARTT